MPYRVSEEGKHLTLPAFAISSFSSTDMILRTGAHAKRRAVLQLMPELRKTYYSRVDLTTSQRTHFRTCSKIVCLSAWPYYRY